MLNTMYPVKSLKELMYDHMLIDEDILSLMIKRLSPLIDKYGEYQIDDYIVTVYLDDCGQSLYFNFNESPFGYNQITFDIDSDTVFYFYNDTGEIMTQTEIDFFDALEYLSDHGCEFNDLILEVCKEIESKQLSTLS